ncbi:hypothetical protein NXH67_08745 [Butyrivibrio sp. DSM 10294]|uniref:glycosyltransferase family protein n=1 Tax=Butyrivibrio sp. DSM 10294 TaxID=2972457 RepID=UPI00234EF128|nr:hypothetical protein [Butyrivibrio sp. DSM 10294]MDC7293602.1 hypothetical protein [Butyrivibrio sp. DSM 10294]
MLHSNHALILRRGNINYDSLTSFSALLSKALGSCGIEVDYWDLDRSNEKLDKRLSEVRYDFALTFNSIGQHNYKVNGENIWNKHRIPFFNYIVDHPQMHSIYLFSECSNYYCLCLDRDHVDYAKRFYKDVKDAFFLPLGGSDSDEEKVDDSFEEFEHREFDVVFTGSYVDRDELDGKILALPEAVRNIELAYLDHMLDNRTLSLEEGLTAILPDFGIDPSDEKAYFGFANALFPITNNYLRSYTREEAVRFLAQSKGTIHLFGTGWDTLDDLENVVLHGSCTYLETAAIYKKSKIVFNVMPYFKNGAHDRIPTSMLAGAAVLTDDSKYYRDVCEKAGHEIMRFWNLSAPEALPYIVDDMLSDPDKLYEIAQRGLHLARGNMTWNRTAEKLVGILENRCDYG